MSSANIIREMAFVKGFRLKNLSLRVKPLNLRGGVASDKRDFKRRKRRKRRKRQKRSLGH